MLEILGLDRKALDRARLSRDPRFDGKFFSAVTSTGIYCRPICPSRPSKSSNVRYYATAAAAAEAGFRPCLRCRPEAAPGTPAWIGRSATVKRALRLINDGALDGGSVDSLAARVGVGSRHLARLFIQHVGASPIAVAQTRRLHFAKHLLDETSLPVTQIALASGFGSIRRFNSAFQKTYGRSPRALRKRPRSGGVVDARDEVALRLAYRPPYHWSQVQEFLAARALPGIERVDTRGYARTVSLPTGAALVCIRPLESENVLELRVRGAPPSALFQLASAARRTFDLAADPAAIAAALESDPLLSTWVSSRPGLRIPGAWDPFECAVRAVLGQQVSVAAGRTLAARLVIRAGQEIATGSEGLTHLFPSPAQLQAANLDGLGITGARIRALEELARAILEGRLDFGLPAPQVASALASLPGFGEWTAQYVSLRALGEPDAFLSGDLVLRRVAGPQGSPLSARLLEARAEAWRPWRGYAVMHLWHMAARAARPPSSKVPPEPKGPGPLSQRVATGSRSIPVRR